MRRHSYRRIFSLMLVLVMLVGLFPASAFAEGDIEINATNFPKMQEVVLEFDRDKNRILSVEERNAVEEIICTDEGINNLECLQYFPNLKILDCSENSLTKLDLSQNLLLEELYCDGNSLTKLDLSNHSYLKKLQCYGNKSLSTLLLNPNAPLWYLDFEETKIRALDLSSFANLTTLRCPEASVTAVDTYSVWADDECLFDLAGFVGETQMFSRISDVTGGNYDSATGKVTLTGLSDDAKTHTVSYKYDTGAPEGILTVEKFMLVTVTVNVPAKPVPTLENIYISNGPTKTVYGEGESFDPTGMVVTATYSDGSTANVTEKCTFSPSGALTSGTTPIAVSYSEGEISKTVTQTITVEYRLYINSANFEDANFLKYVKEELTHANEAYFTGVELTAVTAINVENDENAAASEKISSLKGIEYFTELTTLACGYNNLTTLDVSKNAKLQYLGCQNNSLTSLKLPDNNNLKWLICGNNKLAQLDLSNQTNLIEDDNTTSLTPQSVLANGLWENYKCVVDMSDIVGENISKINSVSSAGNIASFDSNTGKVTLSNVTAGSSAEFTYNYEAKTGTYMPVMVSVYVDSASIASIAITKGPDKTSYTEDEVLDIAGIEITATYTDGTTKAVTSGYSWAPVGPLKLEDTAITVTHNASGLTASWPIAVTEAVPEHTAHTYVDDAEDPCYCTYCEQTTTFNGSPAQVDIDGNLLINAVNFPDEKFRDYINSFEVAGDGKLSTTEVATISEINCGKSSHANSIYSLKGIEFFTALTDLDCRTNKLTELDLSKNVKLTTLDCRHNNLTELDLSKNTKLEQISCGGNHIKTLDIRPNTEVYNLNGATQNCTAVAYWENGKCFVDMKTVVGEENLQYILTVSVSPAGSYDESTGLVSLDDLSTRIYYTYLCGTVKRQGSLGVELTVTIPNNGETGIAIDNINFPDDEFRAIVADKGINKNEDGFLSADEIALVKTLYCRNKGIQDLTGIEHFIVLEELFCDGNQLTQLDLSANKYLYQLNCAGNSLAKLDLSVNENLEYLHCENNEISTLVLPESMARSNGGIFCGNNCIAELNLGTFVLFDLECGAFADDGSLGTAQRITVVGKWNGNSYYVDMNDVLSAGNLGNVELISGGNIDKTTGIITLTAVEDGAKTALVKYGYDHKNPDQTENMGVAMTVNLPELYTVTVENGVGDGKYLEGATVTVTADEPETGKRFKEWTSADGITFADSKATETTFSMPAKAVTVTASYEDIPYLHTLAASIDKLEYSEGESLDLSKVSLTATYSDNSQTTLYYNSEGVTFNYPHDTVLSKEAHDDKMLTVSFGGMNAELGALKVMSADTGISKLTLAGVEGTINGTDIAVELPSGTDISKLSDEDFVIVGSDADAKISECTSEDDGETWTFTVKAENGVIKTYTVNVTVAVPTKTLSGISITTPPTKTAYTVGDVFDPSGMVVTASYSDGSSKEVTDYTVELNSSLTADVTAVTISYTENGVTKTAQQAITVAVPAAKYTITYNANGGSGTMANGTATEGVAFELPENGFTAPDGKQFKAWKIGENEYAPGAEYIFTTATAVTAVWEDTPATAALNAAKAAVLAHDWTVAQKTANDEATVKSWIEEQLSILLDATGVVAGNVLVSDLVPAVAGNAADTDGTNGSFKFSATLSKTTSTFAILRSGPAQTLEVTVTDGVITATVYTAPSNPDVPPVGHVHKWEQAWSRNSTHHWHECLGAGVCDADNDTEGREYGRHYWGMWKTVKHATQTSNGLKERHCVTCGYAQQMLVAAGSSPSTGDTANLPLWLSFMALALCGLGFTGYKLRGRKNKH